MGETTNRNVPSDAAWYCRHDPEEERFYEIFFKLCKKYNVRWASADEKEKQFLSEVARVTYEETKPSVWASRSPKSAPLSPSDFSLSAHPLTTV